MMWEVPKASTHNRYVSVMSNSEVELTDKPTVEWGTIDEMDDHVSHEDGNLGNPRSRALINCQEGSLWNWGRQYMDYYTIGEWQENLYTLCMLLVSCCWNTQQKCQPGICTSRLWEPFKYHMGQASPWELSLSNWDEALYQWLDVFCFCTPTVRRFIPNLINRVVGPQSTISVFSTTDTDRVKVGRGSWFCTGSLANWGLGVWFARNW